MAQQPNQQGATVTPIRVQPVDPAQLSPQPSLWIYGDSGVGKSHLLGTVDNACYAAIKKEHGAYVIARGGGTNVRVVEITTTEDVRGYYRYLREGYHRHGFRVGGIDSTTHLQDVMMVDIVTQAHRENPAKRDPDIPALPDYLRFQIQIKKLMLAFNALPMAMVYTAARQFVEIEDEAGNPATLHLPQLESKQAKVAMKLCGEMMVVAYYGISRATGKRTMLFKRTGNYFAKDRDGRLGDTMEEPTLRAIFDKMQYRYV